ncbi:MAG: hypothetical protein K5841_06170 [Fretibacterium sp.]|nr:hypothetical protein [Fretibacterium sp.]
MIMTTPVSCRAALVTNKGTDSSGKLVRGSVGITGLSAGADNTKLYNVAALLSACVAHPVLTITKTETVELSDE